MDHLLKKFGLDLREVAIYKACLHREFNTPSSIARDTGIKRTTIYLSLEKLKEKNLVHSKIKKNKKYITAVSPEVGLKNYIEEKRTELSLEEQMIAEIQKFAEGEALKKQGSTSVSYLEGTSGVRMLLNRILEEREDIYWLGSMKTLFSVISDTKLYEQFTKKRLEQGTTTYAITDRTITEHPNFYDPKAGFRNYRFLKNTFTIPAFFIIFGKKICLISIENNIAKIILIGDALLESIMKFLFMGLWGNLE